MSATNGEPVTGDHMGELAELHALGALEPHERLQVEAHVANCSNCARALGAAQATVAALDDAFVPQIEPPQRLASRIAASAKARIPRAPRRVARAVRAPSRFYATAAVLLLAAGVGGGALVERSVANSADARLAAADSAVLATIATSHFNHVTLVARAPGAPVSKVLYARDGAWFYVVVDSVTCACRVVASSRAGTQDFGPPAARGTTATLFVRSTARPNSIELVSPSGRVVSQAALVYASP